MSKQVTKKAGRVPKKKKKEIMEQLENIVTEGTILGVTNQQLAEKFKVNRETIACYLKEIYKKIFMYSHLPVYFPVVMKEKFCLILRELQILLIKKNILNIFY